MNINIKTRNSFVYVMNFYIRGEKYQFLKIKNNPIKNFKLFVLDYTDHNTWLVQVSKTVVLNSFYCILHVIKNDTLPRNCIYEFQSLNVKNPTSFTKQEYFSNCISIYKKKNKGMCQHIYNVTNSRNTFINVKIKQINFTGWKVPGCIYGGVSFHESYMDLSLGYGFAYHETFNLCGNYTFYKQLFTNRTESLDNKNIIGEYTSASSNILISLNHHLSNILNITFELSTTSCKGIFANPCIGAVFPFNLKLHNILDYPTDQVPCKAVQIGFSVLFTARLYSSSCLRYGAADLFKINHTKSTWCGANLKYFQIFHESRYNSLENNETFKGDAFVFYYNVQRNDSVFLQKSKFECRECLGNLNNFFERFETNEATGPAMFFKNSELHRGVTIYDIEKNKPKYKTQSRSFEILLSPHKTQTGQYDSFWTTVKLFSESISILTFNYIKCNQSSQVQLQTGTSSLSSNMNENICLRKPVKGILKQNMIIELTFEGKVNCYTCSLGILKFYSNLCYSFREAYSDSLIGIYHIPFEFCVDKKTNYFGEDQLIWTANLTYDIFYSSNMKLLVDLPGKLFDAEFLKIKDICRSGVMCQLKYTWTNIPPPKFITDGSNLELYIRQIRNDYFYEKHKYQIVSRDLWGDYEEPVPHNWYEANETCSLRGENLPSFTSYEEVEDLLNYLKRVSWSALVNYMFVGIYQKV